MKKFDLNQIANNDFFIDEKYKCFLFLFNSDNLDKYFIDSLSGETYLTNTGKNINFMLNENFDISVINNIIKENQNYQIDLFIIFKNDNFLKFFSIIHYNRYNFLNTIYQEEYDEKFNLLFNNVRKNLIANRGQKDKITEGIICENNFSVDNIKNDNIILFDVTNIVSDKENGFYHCCLNKFSSRATYSFMGILNYNLCPMAFKISEKNNLVTNLINSKTMSYTELKEMLDFDFDIEDVRQIFYSKNKN